MEPLNSVSTPWSVPNRSNDLAQRRHQASLLEHGRAQARHQPAKGVGLLRELLADLRQHLQPALDVAGLDHEQRRLQRERRGATRPAPVRRAGRARSRLRSASIAGFVRRRSLVRSSSRSWRNWKSERIVWSATFAAVTSRDQQQRAGGSVGICETRDSRKSGWPSGRWSWPARSRAGRAKRRRRRRTDAASTDHGCPSIAARSIPTIRQNASLARMHHAALVQLHDAVHGGVEHQPQVLLGLAEGLVRFPDPLEREVRFVERGLPPRERLFRRLVCLRAGDLVGHHASGDPSAEKDDQQRGLERSRPPSHRRARRRSPARRTPSRSTRCSRSDGRAEASSSGRERRGGPA